MEIVKFFQVGGPFMYPILIVLAFGIAIAIERFLYISKTESGTNKLWRQLISPLKASDYADAKVITDSSSTPLALMLNYGFARQGASGDRDDIESAMEEGLMEIIPALEKRTHYLATFANISMQLGLLGTIIGLIQAFNAVASADPAEKADLLSASISVAMSTTAFGLIVAIPLILIHSYLSTRTSHLVDNLEMAAVKCLNLMTKN